MTQTTFALLTNKGRSKEAVALANGSDIVVTHIAIGDGTTVPSGGETKLYHEVDRKAITGHGVVTGTTNTAYFDIHLMAADGPYTIREAGLYDADGDLIAIAYYDPPIQKPTPDSGQTVEGDIRLEIAFSNVENIIVQVDTSMQVPLQRLTVCPWIPVKSAAFINPPSEPKVGDAYVIPDRATGVWKGQSQKIAEFTSAGWAITETPDGHGIGLPDGSVYVKVNGQYQLLQQLFQNSFDLRYSQLVAPPADTFYVVGPSGSDKNSGLKPTPDEGFATIQGAIDVLCGRYITQGTITLKISAGTYDGFIIGASLIQNWSLIGDAKNVAAYRIVSKRNSVRAGLGFGASSGHVTIRGFTFKTDAQSVVSTGAVIKVYDCSVSLIPNYSPFSCYDGGSLKLYGEINCTGNGSGVFDVQQGGKLELGYKDQFIDNTAYVNFSNCRCESVFVLQNTASAIANPACCKFAGAITGRKYTIQLNSVVQTYGGGANFLPGDSAGIITTGGQIV